jgi:hypothetical protein
MGHIARFISTSYGSGEKDFGLLTDVVFTDIGKISMRIEFLDNKGLVLFSRGTLAPVET